MSETRNSIAPEGHKHEEKFDHGFLQVSSIHHIHYEQYGKPEGKPVVFLHGGPGGRTTFENTEFFDPGVYRVILFDQRGSGQSLPVAELRENTSQDLVSDIEALREHLGISKWMVFGGSWGSTLALLYAQTHPDRVTALVLRGVFTMRKSEMLFAKGFTGAAYLFPEAFDEFLNYLPPEERNDPYPNYHKHLTSDDLETQKAAARAWNKWEMGISNLILDEASLADMLSDETWSLQHARMEIHYETNGGFLEEGQLLKPDNIEKIKHIPCSIVQGRYDIVCPAKTAWELHKALPDSKLYMIPDAGHSAKEPGMKRKLIEVCDEYAPLQ